MEFNKKDCYSMDDLVAIVAILRGKDGCPWDQVQTHESIRYNFIEEVYEVLEALDHGNREALEEELGDVLLQVVFHAQIEKEQEAFALEDVIDRLCRKLIFRHPHVFDGKKALSPEEALVQWEEKKKEEKHQTLPSEALLAVPAEFPALMRAQKVGKRAQKAGILKQKDAVNWINQLEQEVKKLKQAIQTGEEEPDKHLGEALFLCANIARELHGEAEDLLQKATDQFIDQVHEQELPHSDQSVRMQLLHSQ